MICIALSYQSYLRGCPTFLLVLPSLPSQFAVIANFTLCPERRRTDALSDPCVWYGMVLFQADWLYGTRYEFSYI